MNSSDLENWRAKSRIYAAKYENPDSILELEKVQRLNTALSLADLRETGQILNVGVGAGQLFTNLPENVVGRCIGLDFSPDMIRLARSNRATPKYIQGSADELPLKDNSVDLVFCLGVLGHLPKGSVESTIKELGRVMAEGGQLILSYANSNSPFRWLRRKYFRLRDIPSDYDSWNPSTILKFLGQVGITVRNRRFLTYSTGLVNTRVNKKIYQIYDDKLKNSGIAGHLAMTHVLDCRR